MTTLPRFLSSPLRLPLTYLLFLASLLLIFALRNDHGTKAQTPVTTRAYSNARTGATLVEKYLNTSTVNPTNFGKLFSRKVVGQVYAQVLYVPNLLMKSTNMRHDVNFVVCHIWTPINCSFYF